MTGFFLPPPIRSVYLQTYTTCQKEMGFLHCGRQTQTAMAVAHCVRTVLRPPFLNAEGHKTRGFAI